VLELAEVLLLRQLLPSCLNLLLLLLLPPYCCLCRWCCRRARTSCCCCCWCCRRTVASAAGAAAVLELAVVAAAGAAAVLLLLPPCSSLLLLLMLVTASLSHRPTQSWKDHRRVQPQQQGSFGVPWVRDAHLYPTWPLVSSPPVPSPFSTLVHAMNRSVFLSSSMRSASRTAHERRSCCSCSCSCIQRHTYLKTQEKLVY